MHRNNSKTASNQKARNKVTGKKPYRMASHTRGKVILIVCEGQTEEQYFKSFPIVTATVKAVPLGMSKVQLVERAKLLAKLDRYDEVWCVFDMDFKPGETGQLQEYDRAIELAHRNKFHCAYSNDSFELWFVLHYQYIDQQNHRTFYFKTLSRYWGINYEKHGKEKAFSSTIYTLLDADEKSSQQKAIANAERLSLDHDGKPFHRRNPATTVHILVNELNRHLRR